MKRNILMRRVGSVVVFRESKEDPGDAEWDEFLHFLVENRAELGDMRMLIRTDGGVANAGQRKRLAATLGDTQPLVAVVSDAMKVRFAGSTIALFQKNYRQYTTKELYLAFEHLKMTTGEQRSVQLALTELEQILFAAT